MEWEGGMTVDALLKKCNFTFPLIIVKVNDTLVPKEDYTSYVIRDNDDVKVIHLTSGG
jgi:thiamine biosynthesis protein ThiS